MYIVYFSMIFKGLHLHVHSLFFHDIQRITFTCNNKFILCLAIIIIFL